MFHYRNDPGDDGVGVVFSNARDARGSVLNLGGHHGARGRPPGVATLEEALGVRVAVVRQVHGRRVLVIDQAALELAAESEADGMVTRTPGIALGVRVADCVPVLLADARAGIVGAAHAGRQGLALGVLPRAVAVIRELGGSTIRAWIGPHICGSCYEVPEALAEEVAAIVPGTRSTTSWGTPALDLGAGAEQVLTGLGVRVTRIEGCTRTTPSLHSYRRDGAAAGRQAGCIWLPPRVSR